MERSDDPARPFRLVLGILASALMTLSVFFTLVVHGFMTGEHSSLVRTDYGMREAIVAVVGLGALWFILNPHKPDARVAQSAMLAAAIVSLALGATYFFGAFQSEFASPVSETWPGPQAWMLMVAGLLFVSLRFKRALWPESRWMAELHAKAEGRSKRR